MPLAWLTSGSIVLPPLPKWSGPVTSAARTDFMAAVHRHSPHAMGATPQDDDYILTPEAVRVAAVDWALIALAKQGIVYTASSFDCENFVNEVDQVIRKIAAKAGIKATPLTGCLAVSAQFPWAGIPAGGAHALMGTLTHAGLVISESQNRQSTPIESYPNRALIYEVSNL